MVSVSIWSQHTARLSKRVLKTQRSLPEKMTFMLSSMEVEHYELKNTMKVSVAETNCKEGGQDVETMLEL